MSSMLLVFLSGGRLYTLQYCMARLKKKKFSFSPCWLLLNSFINPIFLLTLQLHRVVMVTHLVAV